MTNLRKLAQELTPSIGPGDYVRVALTREGKETGQGVGHLDDGSMVVVNGGHDLVGGPEVMLQVTSVVPTAAVTRPSLVMTLAMGWSQLSSNLRSRLVRMPTRRPPDSTMGTPETW